MKALSSWNTSLQAKWSRGTTGLLIVNIGLSVWFAFLTRSILVLQTRASDRPPAELLVPRDQEVRFEDVASLIEDTLRSSELLEVRKEELQRRLETRAARLKQLGKTTDTLLLQKTTLGAYLSNLIRGHPFEDGRRLEALGLNSTQCDAVMQSVETIGELADEFEIETAFVFDAPNQEGKSLCIPGIPSESIDSVMDFWVGSLSGTVPDQTLAILRAAMESDQFSVINRLALDRYYSMETIGSEMWLEVKSNDSAANGFSSTSKYRIKDGAVQGSALPQSLLSRVPLKGEGRGAHAAETGD